MQEEFRARKTNGFIRECHGDLHLGNIALIENLPVLFDCIEFNENLRWIDVMSEMVFLIMNMEEIQMKRSAYRILNHYLEYTGDYSGLNVFTFYAIYSAMVRAKVAILQKKDPTLYLDLAKILLVPDNCKLYITHGLSGSGKTFTTSRLLEEYSAIRIRSDVERKRIQRNDIDLYSIEKISEIYLVLQQMTETILKSGFSVIVDATFLKRIHRDNFRFLAQKFGVEFFILNFDSPLELLEERIRYRTSVGFDASDADVGVLRSQIQMRENLSEEEMRYVKTMQFYS